MLVKHSCMYLRLKKLNYINSFKSNNIMQMSCFNITIDKLILILIYNLKVSKSIFNINSKIKMHYIFLKYKVPVHTSFEDLHLLLI